MLERLKKIWNLYFQPRSIDENSIQKERKDRRER